jgi:hypothetical protein
MSTTDNVTETAAACCSATTLQTCCAPEDKSECCGATPTGAGEAPSSCGCQ